MKKINLKSVPEFLLNLIELIDQLFSVVGSIFFLFLKPILYPFNYIAGYLGNFFLFIGMGGRGLSLLPGLIILISLVLMSFGIVFIIKIIF